jgi:hypothetical protein
MCVDELASTVTSHENSSVEDKKHLELFQNSYLKIFVRSLSECNVPLRCCWPF